MMSKELFKKLLGNSHDRETVQNMSPDDSSLRTGSIWLAFVTGGNTLDSQKCFIITSHTDGWVRKLTIPYFL